MALKTSKPTQAACAAFLGVTQITDTDNDKIQDRTEFCGYGSSRTVADSDGDGRNDACEIGSLNTLPAVNSLDQLVLAQAIQLNLSGTYTYNSDLNKDGAINSQDQLLLSNIITGAGCPPS